MTIPDLLQDTPGPDPAEMEGNPSPEERADYVVRRLAQFIRDGRTIEGMPYKQWEQMALTEIANAVADAENNMMRDDMVSKRLLFTTGAALVTIGFWGTAFAFDKAHYLLTAIVCAGAGIVLLAVAAEWRVRKYLKGRQSRRRAETLSRVEDLNRRIRKMEKELEEEAKGLEKALKVAAKAWGGKKRA